MATTAILMPCVQTNLDIFLVPVKLDTEEMGFPVLVGITHVTNSGSKSTR